MRKTLKEMNNECNTYIHYLTLGTIVLFIVLLLMLMIQALLNILQIIGG